MKAQAFFFLSAQSYCMGTEYEVYSDSSFLNLPVQYIIQKSLPSTVPSSGVQTNVKTYCMTHFICYNDLVIASFEILYKYVTQGSYCTASLQK